MLFELSYLFELFFRDLNMIVSVGPDNVVALVDTLDENEDLSVLAILDLSEVGRLILLELSGHLNPLPQGNENRIGYLTISSRSKF